MVFSLNVFVAPANDTRSTTPSTNERLNHIISNAEEHVSSVAFSRSYSSTVVGSQVSFVSCVLSQILRYVYVEAVNVTDETDTSSIKQTSLNDTFPTRVVRHVSQVRQSAQVELRLRANNCNHASHRYVGFLQSVLGVCKVFWSQLVGRQRSAVTGANETVLRDRKSTRLNSSHVRISYAVFCLKKKKKKKKHKKNIIKTKKTI